jgi:hypothetical protein
MKFRKSAMRKKMKNEIGNEIVAEKPFWEFVVAWSPPHAQALS